MNYYECKALLWGGVFLVLMLDSSVPRLIRQRLSEMQCTPAVVDGLTGTIVFLCRLVSLSESLLALLGVA